MKNFFSNNSGDDDSSIFHAKIREEDLATQQKINEAKRLIEELKKQAKGKEKIYEQVKSDTENKLNGLLDDIEVDLKSEQSDGYLAKALKDLYELFGSFFNTLDINFGQNFHYELREKKNRTLLLSMIKSMIDKFKKLVKKLFTRDLTWDKRLDKEIAELEEALDSGELDEEQTRKSLERLDLLKRMKLRIQLYAISLLFTVIFSIFGFAWKIEASKEITKEAREKVEKLETGARQEEVPAEAKKIEENREFRRNIDNLIKPLPDLRKFVPPKREPEVSIKRSPDLSNLPDNKRNLFKSEENKPVEKEVKQEKLQHVASQQKPTEQPASPLGKPERSFSRILKDDNSEARCVSAKSANKTEVLTIQIANANKQEMGDLLNSFLCSEKVNLLGGETDAQYKVDNNGIQSKFADPRVENVEASRSRA